MANYLVTADEKAKINLEFTDDENSTIGLTLFHANKTLLLTSEDPVTITIPLSNTVDFESGTRIRVISGSVSSIVFAVAENVVLLSKNDYVKMDGKGSVVMLEKITTNVWILYGDLIASS